MKKKIKVLLCILLLFSAIVPISANSNSLNYNLTDSLESGANVNV